MKKVLSGITWQNPRGYNPLVASAELWAEKRPQVQVKWQQLPWIEFEQAVLASLEESDGKYDLIMLDHPWVGTLSSRGWLRAYNDLLTSSQIEAIRQLMVPPSFESYEMDGNVWALPIDAACHSALVRSDLTDSAQLPQIWQDVQHWAVSHHDPPHRYGLVLSLNSVLGTCLFLSMMASLGEQPFSTQRTCNRAAAREVLSLLDKLLDFVPPGSTRWGPWDIYEHMIEHDDVAYSPSIFAYVNYFVGGPRQRALRLGLCPGFQGHGPASPILGGVGLGIAHTCPHVEEAVEYALYLASDEVQRNVFPVHNGQPATLDVWSDLEINKRCGSFYNDLAPGMAQAYTRPRDPGFHALELEIGQVLQRFFDREQSLESTLDKIYAVE